MVQNDCQVTWSKVIVKLLVLKLIDIYLISKVVRVENLYDKCYGPKYIICRNHHLFRLKGDTGG